jgi:lactoylglutathione lyase
MELICVRLLVGDFPGELAFWRDVVQAPLKYADDAMGYAYFDLGNAGLELFSRDAFAESIGAATPAPAPAGRQAVLNIRVEDVDASYKDFVDRGATPVAVPTDRPAWNARTAHLADPENNLIEIYSPLQPDDAPPA